MPCMTIAETLPQSFTRVTKLMGNRFEFTVVGNDPLWANEKIDAAIAEVKRIERLFTTFDENSQTNLVNRNAGIKPVQVDKEFLLLTQRAIKISHITQGAFDLTYGGVDKKLWNFDSTVTALPSAEVARER